MYKRTRSKTAVRHSEPDSSSVEPEEGEYICPVCEWVLQGDSILCINGDCKQGLHRCCADLSNTDFKKRLGESNEPVYCSRCCYKKQSLAIREVQETVCSLAGCIEELQATANRALPQPSSSPSSLSISSTGSIGTLLKSKNSVHRSKPNNSSVELESECICPVCKIVIIDSSDNSIFCDGDCKQWLHRCCAKLSWTAFEKLGDSTEPFYCPRCCCKGADHTSPQPSSSPRSLSSASASETVGHSLAVDCVIWSQGNLSARGSRNGIGKSMQ